MRDLIGRTLGHYRVVEKIGEGGMGEVYRAHDERLDRHVAVKVLPEVVAGVQDRLERFEREAKLLASLNHPNIATLHGFEEEDRLRYLVMELVEGESLASVIGRGAIPFDEALAIALQISKALEAAHEHGVIHRDLKPANVMLDSEGGVKVLDFGLAKAFDPEASGPMSPESIAESPTLTADMTRAGVLLGTAPYMSPEQAHGKVVDKRADVWAFGCVLYEMLTGTRAFVGATSTEVLAGIIKGEPDWGVLPAETPITIIRLLRRSLTKDSRDRLHDIADARLEIEEAITGPDWAPVDQMERPEPTFRESRRAAWPVTLAAVVVTALIAFLAWRLSDVRWTESRRPVRVALNLPAGVTIHAEEVPLLAMSPDGRWLVFGVKRGSPQETLPLFKRSLERFDATPMPGTEGGHEPFFSPDGRWVGFFAGGKLKKVPLDGGSPQILAETPYPWGGTWGPDGTIVFNRDWANGLWRVPASGGEAEQLAAPQFEQGDWDLAFPEYLPGGRAVLFTVWRGITGDSSQVCVLDLESLARKTLINNAYFARYVPTGHLIFGREGATHIVPFEAGRREITGPSMPVPEPIFNGDGVPHLAFSAVGTLAFIPGGGAPKRQLVSVDLEGKETPLIEARRGFMYPRFSPDGSRLAVNISEPHDSNIWVIDLETGARSKLTHEGANFFPFWTPDGERVTYLSVRGGSELRIDMKRADGHGDSESLVRLNQDDAYILPGSWSPDATALVYMVKDSQFRSTNIWIAVRDGGPELRPLVETGANNVGPAISPDGRWLAYVSIESGQNEVYVQPFPAGGERHQVSTDGGRAPVWSPDGQSIYYRRLDQILAVPVTMKPRFRPGTATVLFEGRYGSTSWMEVPNFDIAPDGKSFVMVKPDEEWGRATEIRVVLNWFEELKRLAPTE